METLINIDVFPVKPSKIRHFDKQAWIRRARERKEAQKKQLEGIESQEIFKASIEAKLIESGAGRYVSETGQKWFDNFLRCGVESFVIMCGICGTCKECKYQCGLKWCPLCNWRITMKRRKLLEKLTAGMCGVKHVVLTQKNFEHLTHAKIQQSRKALFKLRQQGIFGEVTGGCASLEFTNEENGWHMHWHLLVQSNFIPADQLSINWGKLVGQEFAIVKVMAVDEKSYLQEICKYVVDGSELAKWKPWQILEFVIALRGTRTFSTFGKFREIAKFARALAECDKPEPEHCACGMDEWIYGHDKDHARRIADKYY